MIRKIGISLMAALVFGCVLWLYYTRQPDRQTAFLAKLDQIVRVTSEPVLDCKQIAAQKPYVILALGQSNAGNHGARVTSVPEPVILIADDKCIMATDPLPGSTGEGGSIWSRLSAYLATQERQRPLVLSVMGIDATSISDWTDDQSPLRHRLKAKVDSMRGMGLLPTHILWQQGEADAQLGTTSVVLHSV